jgi:hypothetical protein
MLFLLLLALTPPPPPSPDAAHEIPVCSIQLELPRGGIVVGKVCRVNGSSTSCDGAEVISLADAPAFAEESRVGARGVLLPPAEYSIREERYASEVRYVLMPASRRDKRYPYLSAPEPIRAHVERRACPEGALFLEKGQDLVLFASGGSTAKVGQSLRSFAATNAAGPWLLAVFARVR